MAISHGSCTFLINSMKNLGTKMPSMNTPKIKPSRSWALKRQYMTMQTTNVSR